MLNEKGCITFYGNFSGEDPMRVVNSELKSALEQLPKEQEIPYTLAQVALDECKKQNRLQDCLTAKMCFMSPNGWSELQIIQDVWEINILQQCYIWNNLINVPFEIEHDGRRFEIRYAYPISISYSLGRTQDSTHTITVPHRINTVSALESIKHYPPENDPSLMHIKEIKEDSLLIHTLLVAYGLKNMLAVVTKALQYVYDPTNSDLLPITTSEVDRLFPQNPAQEDPDDLCSIN